MGKSSQLGLGLPWNHVGRLRSDKVLSLDTVEPRKPCYHEREQHHAPCLNFSLHDPCDCQRSTMALYLERTTIEVLLTGWPMDAVTSAELSRGIPLLIRMETSRGLILGGTVSLQLRLFQPLYIKKIHSGGQIYLRLSYYNAASSHRRV